MYSSEPQPAPRTIASRLRERLGRRSALLLIGFAVVAAGAIFNWDWLVALGVAPLLLTALPCVAMCALGLCMNRAGRQACAKDTGSPERAAHGDAKRAQ